MLLLLLAWNADSSREIAPKYRSSFLMLAIASSKPLRFASRRSSRFRDFSKTKVMVAKSSSSKDTVQPSASSIAGPSDAIWIEPYGPPPPPPPLLAPAAPPRRRAVGRARWPLRRGGLLSTGAWGDPRSGRHWGGGGVVGGGSDEVRAELVGSSWGAQGWRVG